MIVRAAVDVYVASEDVERAGGSLRQATEDNLDHQIVEVEWWSYDTNQEYDEADTEGSVLNTMTVDE